MASRPITDELVREVAQSLRDRFALTDAELREVGVRLAEAGIDVTVMPADQFDAMIASLDVPDDSSRLHAAASRRQYVATPVVLRAFADAPEIDFARFRADVDAVVEGHVDSGSLDTPRT